MSLGYTGAYGSGGAAAGLETLLARRFKEQQAAEQAQQFQRQQAEVERARQAQEAHQQQQLEESSRLREATLGQTAAQQEANRQNQVNLQTLIQTGLNERFKGAESGRNERADTMQDNLMEYRGRLMDEREKRSALEHAVATGRLDNQQAAIEIQRSNVEIAALAQKLRELQATPEHAGQVSQAQAAGKEAAKPPSFLQGIKNLVFPGQAAQPAGTTPRMVRLKAPTGQIKEVPAEQAEQFLKRGAVVVP